MGEGREPQESLLAGYLLAGYTPIGFLLFLDVLVQTQACAKNAKGFYNFVSKTFPLH